VLNPATPIATLDEVLIYADYVLLMSVNPGFGGQRLIPSVLDKARRLRSRIDELGLDVRLEIDGGVDRDNLDDVARTGVDMIVSGSAIFGSDNPRETTHAMTRRLAEIERDARSV
jgi:ribulose-phosphate 3-epimerase